MSARPRCTIFRAGGTIYLRGKRSACVGGAGGCGVAEAPGSDRKAGEAWHEACCSPRRQDGATRDRPRHAMREGAQDAMLGYAAMFFLVADVAALFGFGGLAAGTAGLAQALFYVFLILFVASLRCGLITRK